MHQKVHTEETKICHFFKAKTHCPFEKIGCMNNHEAPGDNTEEIMDVSDSEETSEVQNEDQVKEQVEAKVDDQVEETEEDQVECRMCECTFLDSEELEYHVQTSHLKIEAK